MKLYFPFVQIAGIKSKDDILILREFEKLYIGFPFFLDYHKEEISLEEAKKWIEEFKIREKSILITYLDKAEKIAEVLDYLGIRIVQLHGEIELSELKILKEMNKYILIKSIIIGKNEDDFEKYESYIDAFITDTYDDQTGASGATGRTHDWKMSSSIIVKSFKPVILAGGLNPQNVRNSIEFCLPAGVDCHTGVEDEKGFKNYEKVKSFYEISMNYLKNRY